ncbi:cell division protein ZapC domain-containing protein [Arsukibacterium sp.]|uniref:cell division protein ZapC domain-containing protein n=1 Tax=Arsukibacterium sp. TaxID=1977258 RepID=UPI002FD8BD13
MLTPTEHWSWQYCPVRDRLLLDISEQLQFCSVLNGRQLREKPTKQLFSMADAAAYWDYHDSLALLNLPAAEQLELCLHALAARYAQQGAHKSWYFAEQPASAVTENQLIEVVGAQGAIPALVLAAEADCVTCILLDAGNSLSGKPLARCTVLRLLRSRVRPLLLNNSFARSA